MLVEVQRDAGVVLSAPVQSWSSKIALPLSLAFAASYKMRCIAAVNADFRILIAPNLPRCSL